MSRYIFRIVAAIFGYNKGMNAYERSQARAAANPLLEGVWTAVKIAVGLGLVVWLFGFHGMHEISVGLQDVL